MRYFDKNFFKFTFGFLSIVLVSLFVIWATANYVQGREGQTAQIREATP